MLDFYKTQGGRRFIDGTVPRLIEVLDRLATAVEKSNELREAELALQVPEVPSPKIQTCDVEGCSNAAEMCCNECDVVVCSDHWESADEAGCHCHPAVDYDPRDDMTPGLDT